MNEENNEWSTIKIPKEQHKKLKEMKIHDNQAFWEVIEKLIEEAGGIEWEKR